MLSRRGRGEAMEHRSYDAHVWTRDVVPANRLEG